MNDFVLSGGPAYDVSWFLTARKAGRAEQGKPRVAFKAIGSTADGVIIGIGAAAGSPTKLDLDGEFFDRSDLVSMAYDYCSSRDRTFKANHRDKIDCDLVASWPGSPIIREDGRLRTLKSHEVLSDEHTVVGINVEKGKETHWFVGVKPRDPDVVALAAKGGVAGFSVGVLADRVPVRE